LDATDPSDAVVREACARGSSCALIGLHDVYVHQVLKDGLPYVGYEFGCTWDGEHGLGVLVHGTRVVEVGGAQTAMTLWIAKQDAHGDAGE
jgi:hypothetical protein